jgi:hypothetical protein
MQQVEKMSITAKNHRETLLQPTPFWTPSQKNSENRQEDTEI